MENDPPPIADRQSLALGEDMTLVMVAPGELVLIHAKLVDPVAVDVKQLRSWLRRQLREVV